MKKTDPLTRTLEIIPGLASWGILILFFILAFYRPITCAILIIIFDFYWIIRTVYLTSLLIFAYRKLSRQKNRNWMSDCLALNRDCQKPYHLVIFPVYKEGPEILCTSLSAITKSSYPKEKIIVVVSFEERNNKARENALILEKEFKDYFSVFFTTFHPANIAGETKTKGANATWAAKKAKELLDNENIAYENVIISCFDADTCVDKNYFACLTYHFLANPKPHQASYQPMPVYNNNVWYAPSFARLVEISSSFSQLIESMRLEKFVTFSSHSMSFKTLVDIDYWPVDMISDDSVVYWKAYLHFNGDYRVVPLYITVSMDVAYSTNLYKTIVMQYKQKRRWAWGIENFPYVVTRFIKNRDISWPKKIRRSYHLLEGHITWAVWAFIVTLMPSLPFLFGGIKFGQISIGYNLPRITGLLFNFTIGVSIIWIILSRTTMPPRPKDVGWAKNVVMICEWLLVPIIILVVGSTPALDAQTRLMFGRNMEFYATEKKRKQV
jgi:hypothetical protein